jgi:predicted dithiol-disulfide oxidoreductase (DUF899 family)
MIQSFRQKVIPIHCPSCSPAAHAWPETDPHFLAALAEVKRGPIAALAPMRRTQGVKLELTLQKYYTERDLPRWPLC